MNQTKKTARVAGLLYLMLAVTSIVGILYIPSTIIVSGDATATANNIASFEFVFRVGILGRFVSQVIFLFLVLTLYRLFKEIDHKLAVLMVTLVVTGISAELANTLNQIAALIVVTGDDILSVFEKPQLDALAYLFLRLNSWGSQAIQIFWGLWLFPFGILVIRSRFLPKVLGLLLILAGTAYLMSSFTFFVLPQYKASLSQIITILEVGEVPIVFWLLVGRIRVPPTAAATS